MSVTTFEWKEDEEYGGDGWIPKRFPNFNASTGLGVAHDALEHFANDDESLAAELRAFGAMLYIRGEGGYFYRMNHFYPNPSYHMGADIGRFLGELNYGEHGDYGDFDEPPRTYRLNEEAEGILDDIMREGQRNFIAELDSEDKFSYSDMHKWLDKMRGWIRVGYRKAVKRYHNANPDELSYIFTRIAEEVDKRFKGAEYGDELKVHMNNRTLEFRLERVDPRYNDYY